MTELFLKASGAFYSLLCIFSIVTGLMYARGKRELNPVELTDRFLSRYDTPEKLKRFTVKMGWVTFAVGIIQGVTAFSIFKAGSLFFYVIALGFTLFSICSVAFKLKGKVSLFAALKFVAYTAILAVLIIARKAYF